MTKDQELIEKIGDKLNQLLRYVNIDHEPIEDEIRELKFELISLCRQRDMQMAIDIVPDMGEEPDQNKYPCEWVLWAERKRVREAIREKFSNE